MDEQKSNQNQDNNNQQNEASNAANEPTPIYLTPNSTLQTPEEYSHDKSIDPRRDTTMETSNDDLHTTNADRMAGSDRAGTAERKPQDMDEENKESEER